MSQESVTIECTDTSRRKPASKDARLPALTIWFVSSRVAALDGEEGKLEEESRGARRTRGN